MHINSISVKSQYYFSTLYMILIVDGVRHKNETLEFGPHSLLPIVW